MVLVEGSVVNMCVGPLELAKLGPSHIEQGPRLAPYDPSQSHPVRLLSISSCSAAVRRCGVFLKLQALHPNDLHCKSTLALLLFDLVKNPVSILAVFKLKIHWFGGSAHQATLSKANFVSWLASRRLRLLT